MEIKVFPSFSKLEVSPVLMVYSDTLTAEQVIITLRCAEGRIFAYLVNVCVQILTNQIGKYTKEWYAANLS